MGRIDISPPEMEKPGGRVGFRNKLKILVLCVYFEVPLLYLRRDVD